MTQSLDFTAFGTFKKAVTIVLTKFGRLNGDMMPVKTNMADIIGQKLVENFTTSQIK